MAGSRGKTVQASHFAMTPDARTQRSAFRLSHTHKTTFNAGILVPLLVMEALPGDTIRGRASLFVRLLSQIVPVMDNLYVETQFFFTPYRILWDNWERFMGEKTGPADTTQFILPVTVFAPANMLPGSLADYMGLTNNGSANNLVVSSLPFRAYNLIYNEWYRDQDLIAERVVQTDDGPDSPGDMVVARRGKRHDYFTSARPWPQKPTNVTDSGFNQEPIIPGGRMFFPQSGAPVTGLGVNNASPAPAGGAVTVRYTGNRSEALPAHYTGGQLLAREGLAASDNFPDIRVLINDIRTANAVQLLLERNARGGTRYAEILRSHFGVMPPDFRLQRPEFLGGGSSRVQVQAIAQSSATGLTGGTTPLAELAGTATAAGEHSFGGSFTEHGVIIGLMSVRADLTYQEGVNRMFWRRTMYDFYWPSLAHLGEQAVANREIFADGSANDILTFGYQERWAEYRSLPNRVSGVFRSSVASSLDVWHLAQEFGTVPTLGATFIGEDPPIGRILAVPATEFLCDSFMDIKAVRPLPMYSIPGMGPRL